MTNIHDQNNQSVDLIDVEEYAKAGKTVGDADKYKIKVDKEKYIIHHAIILGREVLTLSGNIPVEQYRLDLKFKGGITKKVELEDHIDLRAEGTEKFFTMKLDQTEG